MKYTKIIKKEMTGMTLILPLSGALMSCSPCLKSKVPHSPNLYYSLGRMFSRKGKEASTLEHSQLSGTFSVSRRWESIAVKSKERK